MIGIAMNIESTSRRNVKLRNICKKNTSVIWFLVEDFDILNNLCKKENPNGFSCNLNPLKNNVSTQHLNDEESALLWQLPLAKSLTVPPYTLSSP